MKNIEKLDKITNRFYISQHYEDWHPRFFEKYDFEDMKRKLDELNPDAFYATARTHNGKWFLDAGWGNLHRRLNGFDQFKGLLDFFHAKGKPVMAYFSCIYDKELYDEHTEWRQVDRNGTPLLLSRGSWGKIVCPNSPYREYLVEASKAIAKTYDLDGFYYDMTFFDERPCYCKYCAQQFKAQYGADLPEKEDWNDPIYRKFMQFRMETNYTFVREITRGVKSVKPDLSVCVQYVLLKPGHSLPGQSIQIGKEVDYVYSDIYFGGGYLPMSTITKVASNISKYRPEIGIMTRPGNHNDTPNMKTLNHLRSEAFTAIANGGALMLFDIMWANGTLHQAMYDRMAQVFKEVKLREPWLGGKPIKDVAVLYSEKTRLWYGRDNMPDRYDSNLMGICRALVEEHIQHNIITDLTDDELSGYKTLILPNTVCLSGEEIDTIARFVKNGGGLICTEKTSLWDENGDARKDFGLSEVLGVNYAGNTGSYSRVFSLFDVKEPIAARIPEDGLVNNWGVMQKVYLNGASTLARMVFPYAEPTGDKFVNIMANPPSIVSDWPACTFNEYGKGKAIYFAGAIDKDYVKYSYPELKYIIIDAVKTVSPEAMSIELKAPSCVELNAYEQNEGRQLVIHLNNVQPEIGKTYVSNGVESRHLINEILPVYNLELKLRTDKEPVKITLQPENLTLQMKKADDGFSVSVPALENHSMVIMEF